LLALHAVNQFSSEALASRSIQLFESREYPKSTELAAAAVSKAPYNGYARWRLGTNELYLERHKDAIRTFEGALPFMPHQPQILRVLGQAHYFLGDYSKAAAVLSTFFAMEPEPRVAPEIMQRMLGQSYYRTSAQGDAAVSLASAEDYPEHRAELLQSRIVNAILMNHVISADYLYRRLRHLYPNAQLSSAELFTGAIAEGKLDSAVRFLEFLRLRGDSDLSLRKILAVAYGRANRLDEALTILREIKAVAPGDPEVHLFLGDLLLRKGDTEGARTAYREHLRLDPKSDRRGEIEKRLGGKS
jgi:tetratricopeptide (TPR) repeat protein